MRHRKMCIKRLGSDDNNKNNDNDVDGDSNDTVNGSNEYMNKMVRVSKRGVTVRYCEYFMLNKVKFINEAKS